MTLDLASVSLFAGLDPALLAELAARARTLRVPAGDLICEEGQPGDSLFVIRRGLAQVVVGATAAGRLRRGDVVGEMSLLTGEPRSASVRASVPTDVVEFDRAALAGALSSNPALLGNLTRILSDRLARTTRAQATRGARGEAVALVVVEGGERFAGEVVEAARAANPGSTKAVDLRAVADAESLVAEAVSRLDDDLGDNRLVIMLVDEDQAGADAVLLQADRVIALGGRRAVSAFSARVPDVETVVVGAVDAPGCRVVRTIDPDDPRPAVAWIGRHLSRTKLGLALGAGGAKGYAHVGVLQVLREAGYVVDAVAGSSIGAVIGACIGLGMGADAVESAMRKAFTPDNVGGMFSLSFAGTSTGGDTMVRILHDLVGDALFSDCSIPVVAMTVDLDARVPVPLSDGPLLDALRAATALAGFVPPHVRGTQRLIDALALVPVPTEALATTDADVTLSVNIMNTHTLDAWPGQPPPEPPAARKQRMLDVLLEVMDMAQLEASARHAALADVVVTPRFGPATWRDFHLADLFLAAGRAAAEDVLADLAALAPAGGATGSLPKGASWRSSPSTT